MALSSLAHSDRNDALAQLVSLAQGRKTNDLAYAGEILPQEVFEYLKLHPGLLADVRSLPEWQFTGIPELSHTAGRLATVSWKSYPDFALNARFPEQIAIEAGDDKDLPIFFMCRSGGRSLDAAIAMTAAGYRYCFNITGGFEGDPDTHGHRGQKHGWKSAQLPWKQG